MNDQTSHEPDQPNPPAPRLRELNIRITDGEGRRIEVSANEDEGVLDILQKDGSEPDPAVVILLLIDAIGELNMVLEGLREEHPESFPVTN
jgi:hypothetical protein